MKSTIKTKTLDDFLTMHDCLEKSVVKPPEPNNAGNVKF